MTTLNKKLVRNSAELESEDLLIEIFLRLPTIATERFITACKQWQSLLTTPTFRNQWRANLKPSTGLFLGSKNPLFVRYSPRSNKPNIPQLKIHQSCNGLLLCSTGSMYQVYNPTTGAFFTLPELGKDLMKPCGRILTMRLAFDPLRFGRHYKVVCVVRTLHRPRVHIYSSKTCNWKSLSVIQYDKIYDNGVYWNGAILWIRGLTYFDVENESFKRFPRPPPSCGDWRANYYFGESCDCLYYSKVSSSMDLYELKRDFSGWVLKYHVNLSWLAFDMSVLSVVHGANEDDDPFLVLKTKKGIARYNLVSKMLEKLPVSLIGGNILAFQYIESQCSVC